MNEKEAIETYKNFLDDISKNGGCTIDIDFQHKKEYEAMWEILNFIEKCKSNINTKNKRLKEYAEEVAKKDKIINLMAEWINRIDSTIFCDKEKCDDNCKECVIKHFNHKIEKGE